MKKLFIAIACLTICGTASAQTTKPAAQAATTEEKTNPNAGKFRFVEETHDFGEVAEGSQAEYDFVFTNTGKEPILITHAQGSCGCTVPKWPKEPVMPGKKGTIHVTYNTTGRPGPINKDIIVTSNAQQSTMILKIKGSVKAKAAPDANASVAH